MYEMVCKSPGNWKIFSEIIILVYSLDHSELFAVNFESIDPKFRFLDETFVFAEKANLVQYAPQNIKIL